MENETRCTSHFCKDCEKDLFPSTKGEVWAVFVAFMFFGSIIFLINWSMDSSLLAPRCWSKDDLVGVGFLGDHATTAVKQFPIDCDTFTLNKN